MPHVRFSAVIILGLLLVTSLIAACQSPPSSPNLSGSPTPTPTVPVAERDHFDRSWPHLAGTGGVVPLRMAQTADGITITIERAYADANLVVLGLSGDEARSVLVRAMQSQEKLSLHTPDGESLPEIQGSFPSQAGVDGIAAIVAFDASALSLDGVGELELALSLPLGLDAEDGSMAGNGMLGPLVFEFFLPVTPALSGEDAHIAVSQTVEADGLSIALHEVRFGAPDVFATLVLPEEFSYEGWHALMLEGPDGYIAGFVGGRGGQLGPDEPSTARFEKYMPQPEGEWELGVYWLREDVSPISQDWSPEDQLGGPWLFRFTVTVGGSESGPP